MIERPRGLPTLAFPAVVCFGAYLALVIVDRSNGTLRADVTPITVAVLLVASIGYLFAVVGVERASRGRDVLGGHEHGGAGRFGLPLLWSAPIVFRLLLVLTEPTLSDDVYRYLWDGHVLSNGVNPYSYAIAAAELDRLQIPIRDLANNTNLSSPYLPTLQLLFAALAVVAPSEPAVIQLVMVGFDLAAAAVIWKLLAVAGLPTSRVLLYLWHPLVIIESAHGAHFDALMTFLMLAAVLSAVAPAVAGKRGEPSRPARHRLASPVFLALGVLTRPIPALITPVLWWRWRWGERVLFVVVLVGLILPFGFGRSGWGLFGEPTGAGVFGSARVYSTEFRFNAVVATWLERLLQNVETFTAVTGGLMAVVLAVVLWLARPGSDSAGQRMTVEIRRLLRLMVVPIVAYVVLTPVFHPWYLVAVIALAVFLTPGSGEPFARWWLVAPIAYLAATAPLSYLTYQDPENFQELAWVRRVEWWPALLLGVVALGVLALRPAAPRQTRHGDDDSSASEL